MVISLKIHRIKKSFKDKKILTNISFEAKGSDIVGLVGKSGCGKSTLLKILVGYHKSDGGKIIFNGKEVTDELKKIVGFTTQENSFYEKLTIIENMRYYANLYKVEKGRINKLLDQVGLLEHKKKLAENISGGMKRRLDFAISLLHDPQILVLDEPTTGLDPLLVDQFWNIVNEVKKDKIVIMTSHILSEIEKYCTKIAVIKDGKIHKVYRKVKDLEKNFRKMVE